MIKLLMIFTWTLGGIQDSTDTVTIFVLDRNTYSGVRVSETEIRMSFVDRVQVFDRQIYDSLTTLISHFDRIKEGSQIKTATGLDVRLLVTLKVEDLTRTISIGKFDRIAIDGNLVFDYKVGEIIRLLRPFLAPDLNWYQPTREELAKFKRKPQLRID